MDETGRIEEQAQYVHARFRRVHLLDHVTIYHNLGKQCYYFGSADVSINPFPSYIPFKRILYAEIEFKRDGQMKGKKRLTLTLKKAVELVDA